MSVLAILLNYRTAGLSRACAERLLGLDVAGLDVCIVDNASGEGLDELRGFCSRTDVLLLESGRNGGYSAGNNVGLRYAHDRGYDYALIVNPDVEIREAEFFSRSIATLDADEAIAVLGPDIIHRRGFHQNPMREPSYLEEFLWPLETLKARASRRPLYHLDSGASGYCEKVAGCCFFLRVAAIDRVGYLDEGVFLYCEEPILAARVREAGMREYYLADVTAYHMHRGANDLSVKNLERQAASRRYYLERYSGYGHAALKLLLASKRIQTWALARKGSR